MIVLVGLPCSGKTTYVNKHFPKYTFHDDFITDFYDGELMDDMKRGDRIPTLRYHEGRLHSTSLPVFDSPTSGLIVVADPRLCRPETFRKYMSMFESYVAPKNIHCILFENDPVACDRNFMRRVGHRSNEVGLRSNEVGLRSNEVGLRSNAVGLRSNAVYHRSNAVGHRSNAVGHRSNEVGHRHDNVQHTIIEYSKIYDLSEYTDYSYTIVPVYRACDDYP